MSQSTHVVKSATKLFTVPQSVRNAGAAVAANPVVKSTAPIVAGGLIAGGLCAAGAWYADHVSAVATKLEAKNIPKQYQVAGVVGLVAIDSLSLVSIVLLHRRFTLFKSSGGSLRLMQWLKSGMPQSQAEFLAKKKL